MDRGYYQKLAEQGLSMPIGADLVLHAEPDPAAVLRDGAALGAVVVKTARRFQTPLALPLMDLQLEKATLLRGLDIPAADIAAWHFEAPPTDTQMETLRRRIREPLAPQQQVHVDAVSYVARQAPDLVPCGMQIGPFSLTTKLLKDPITPVYLSGMGMTAADDPAVAALERTMELAMLAVERSLRAQLAAGARLICIAEPAANSVYVSPRQIEEGSDVFDRIVMASLRRFKQILDEHQADLFFHCCGELTDYMLARFCELDPAVISLGSSRPLWDVARVVPPTTVLFGNLPSKQFFSDRVISVEAVRAQAAELVARMAAINRPFILASECDVLHVSGCEDVIAGKVEAFLEVGRRGRCGCGCGCSRSAA
jgi:uroporphyrinogen-III decarboxylase